MTPSSAPHPDMVAPVGGRLCWRALGDGQAVVGVLRLPPEMRVAEGPVFWLAEQGDRIALMRQAVGLVPGFPHPREHEGVDDLMRRPVWPQHGQPGLVAVRFLEAFPRDNAWAVYGVSDCPAPAGAPHHRWQDVGPGGALLRLPAPVNPVGQTMGQLLSGHPIWPDANGVGHRLPQLAAASRPTMLRFQRLLMEAARDPAVDATLEARVREDEDLRSLLGGRVDRGYCRFLSELDALGGVGLDVPQDAAAMARRDKLGRQALLAVVAPAARVVRKPGPGA